MLMTYLICTIIVQVEYNHYNGDRAFIRHPLSQTADFVQGWRGHGGGGGVVLINMI